MAAWKQGGLLRGFGPPSNRATPPELGGGGAWETFEGSPRNGATPLAYPEISRRARTEAAPPPRWQALEGPRLGGGGPEVLRARRRGFGQVLAPAPFEGSVLVWRGEGLCPGPIQKCFFEKMFPAHEHFSETFGLKHVRWVYEKRGQRPPEGRRESGYTLGALSPPSELNSRPLTRAAVSYGLNRPPRALLTGGAHVVLYGRVPEVVYRGSCSRLRASPFIREARGSGDNLRT